MLRRSSRHCFQHLFPGFEFDDALSQDTPEEQGPSRSSSLRRQIQRFLTTFGFSRNFRAGQGALCDETVTAAAT
jgi:hypothetical protein